MLKSPSKSPTTPKFGKKSSKDNTPKATWTRSVGNFRIPEIARETLNDRVYVEIKRAIACGKIAPGVQISMRDLSRSIGTSMMPVRGAMQRLTAEGALEILPNRTFTLPARTPEAFKQLCAVRVALEGMATELAAINLSASELDNLKDLYAKMAHVEKRDLTVYLDLHQEFHFSIYRAARSEVLLSILDPLWLQVRPLLNQIMGGRRYSICDDYHGAALRALAKKDGAAARRAIETDITDAAETILKIMEKSQRPKRNN